MNGNGSARPRTMKESVAKAAAEDRVRPFIKMHGLGNHFVIVDARCAPFRPTPDEIVAICDVHTGVGADQLVVIEPSIAATAFMRLYNVDGREVGACGNATRCVAWLLLEELATDSVTVETLAGVLACRRAGSQRVACDMGPLRSDWQSIPLSSSMDTQAVLLPGLGLGHGVAVNVGNPHIVFFTDDPAGVDLTALAPRIQADPLFPEQVNVGLAAVSDRHSMKLAVYERGAGLTRACGSGACAAAFAARSRELVDDGPVSVDLPGGRVVIEIIEAPPVSRAIMTGDVAFAYRGVLL